MDDLIGVEDTVSILGFYNPVTRLLYSSVIIELRHRFGMSHTVAL